MNEARRDFEQFMKRRHEAATAYTNGDPSVLDAMVARRDPATFFGPGGGVVETAGAVAERYRGDAAVFERGSETHFEILHMEASDSLAYWTGFQVARARMKGHEDAIPMKLRVTELFRREGDVWVLIHRHADMNAEAKPKG